LEELGEQEAVCAESELLLSMVKHVIFLEIMAALSSALWIKYICCKDNPKLRRSLQLKEGI